MVLLRSKKYTSISQGILSESIDSSISYASHELINNKYLIDDLATIFTVDDVRSAIQFFIGNSEWYVGFSPYSLITTIDTYSALAINKKMFYGKILECILLKKHVDFKKLFWNVLMEQLI